MRAFWLMLVFTLPATARDEAAWTIKEASRLAGDAVRNSLVFTLEREKLRRGSGFGTCAVDGTACSRPDNAGAYLIDGVMPCCSPESQCMPPLGSTRGGLGTCRAAPTPGSDLAPGPRNNDSFAAARDLEHRCHRIGEGALRGASCTRDGFAVVLPVFITDRIKLKAAAITLWCAGGGGGWGVCFVIALS
jgi:hypothetical protein